MTLDIVVRIVCSKLLLFILYFARAPCVKCKSLFRFFSVALRALCHSIRVLVTQNRTEYTSSLYVYVSFFFQCDLLLVYSSDEITFPFRRYGWHITRVYQKWYLRIQHELQLYSKYPYPYPTLLALFLYICIYLSYVCNVYSVGVFVLSQIRANANPFVAFIISRRWALFASVFISSSTFVNNVHTNGMKYCIIKLDASNLLSFANAKSRRTMNITLDAPQWRQQRMHSANNNVVIRMCCVKTHSLDLLIIFNLCMTGGVKGLRCAPMRNHSVVISISFVRKLVHVVHQAM